MIINNPQSSSMTLFIIGANILQTISSHQFEIISPTLLYTKYCEMFNKVSFSYFMFALDWLFISNTIELTEAGDITRCN